MRWSWHIRIPSSSLSATSLVRGCEKYRSTLAFAVIENHSVGLHMGQR